MITRALSMREYDSMCCEPYAKYCRHYIFVDVDCNGHIDVYVIEFRHDAVDTLEVDIG